MIFAHQAETAAAAAAGSGSVIDSTMNFMVIFDVFIAVYLLYYAIRGEGKLFEGGDFPEAMREEHTKLLRKFCWIVSVPMLVLSVLEYIYSYTSIWATILIIYVLVCIVVYFILFQTRFKKYLHPEKANKSSKAAVSKKKK